MPVTAKLSRKFYDALGDDEAKLEARIGSVAADLHAVLERRLAKQTRWFFVAWASLLIPIVGLWFRG